MTYLPSPKFTALVSAVALLSLAGVAQAGFEWKGPAAPQAPAAQGATADDLAPVTAWDGTAAPASNDGVIRWDAENDMPAQRVEAVQAAPMPQPPAVAPHAPVLDAHAPAPQAPAGVTEVIAPPPAPPVPPVALSKDLPPESLSPAEKSAAPAIHTAMPQTADVAHDATSGDIVSGFGEGMPLVIALQQVVPAGYQFAFAPDVNPGIAVSWEGGKPWPAVLTQTLAAEGLAYHVRSGNVVMVTAQGAQAPESVGAQAPESMAAQAPETIAAPEAKDAAAADSAPIVWSEDKPADAQDQSMADSDAQAQDTQETAPGRVLLGAQSAGGMIDPQERTAAPAATLAPAKAEETVTIRRQKPSSLLKRMKTQFVREAEPDNSVAGTITTGNAADASADAAASADTPVADTTAAETPAAEAASPAPMSPASLPPLSAPPAALDAPAAQEEMHIRRQKPARTAIPSSWGSFDHNTSAPASTSMSPLMLSAPGAQVDSSATPATFSMTAPPAPPAPPVRVDVPPAPPAPVMDSPMTDNAPQPLAPVMEAPEVRDVPPVRAVAPMDTQGPSMQGAEGVETPWQGAKGQTLRDVLQAWSDVAGVELYWSIDYDYRLQDDAAMAGTYDEAVGKLLDRFASVRPQPFGQLHQSAEGPRVLVIKSYDIKQ